uniref:Uncharacterized protein n=1 Tax=Rhizophora mucronata TaxID=61149 RepID=A0A2P2NP23_RHIMU
MLFASSIKLQKSSYPPPFWKRTRHRSIHGHGFNPLLLLDYSAEGINQCSAICFTIN